MITLVHEHDPCAVRVTANETSLIVELDDGRTVSVPLAWYPRLANATQTERQNYEIFGQGSAIEWPDIDEHFSVESILAGRRSEECAESLARWIASREQSK